MSHALRACLLIRLDARIPEWVPVDDLASHLQVMATTVRTELASMWRDGLVQLVNDGPAGRITAAAIRMPS